MFSNPVILLSIFTLVAVLGIGTWQLRAVRASQTRHGEKPGDVTMVKHEKVDDPIDVHPDAVNVHLDPEAVHPEPENRPTPAGDVTSYKQQDAAADGQPGASPSKRGVFWNGKPRKAA